MPRIESPTLMPHGMRGWGVGFAADSGPRFGVAGGSASAYTRSEPTTTEDPMETRTGCPKKSEAWSGAAANAATAVLFPCRCSVDLPYPIRIAFSDFDRKTRKVGRFQRLPCRGFPPDRPPSSVAKRDSGAASVCHVGRRHQDPVVVSAGESQQLQRPQQWRRSQNAQSDCGLPGYPILSSVPPLP